MSSAKIAILLACYNGDKYIREQLDSILAQSYQNWTLYIRDDCSTDSTPEILKEYAQADSRITIIYDDLGNLKPCMNFNEIIGYCIKNSDAQYYAFSDHDDVWLPEKLERLLEIIDHCQASVLKMAYSNYNVFSGEDFSGKLAYDAPFKYGRDEYASRLLMQNWVMGCTMMVSRPLLELSYPVIPQADNHDNWIAIMVALCGEIAYCPQALIMHRIHDCNVTTNLSTHKFFNRVKRVLGRVRCPQAFLEKKRVVALALSSRITAAKVPYNKNIVDRFLLLLKVKGAAAKKLIYENGFYMTNKLQDKIFLAQLKKFNRGKKNA